MPKFSLCSDGVKWFQSRGQFKDGSYVPAEGDIIFFDWGNDGSINHVGIVESVSKGTVNTIEGNSGDAVRRRSYPMGSSRIYGYGVYVQQMMFIRQRLSLESRFHWKPLLIVEKVKKME